jgi:hypothetical protein
LAGYEKQVLHHGFTIDLLVSIAGTASTALVVFPLSTIASDEPGQNSTE